MRTVTVTFAGTTRGMRRLLPIALFTVPFGIAFGAAAAERGLDPGFTIAMSAIVFSGAAQFATLDFWGSDIAYGSLALVTLAISARHIVLGAAVAPWVNQLPLAKRLPVLVWLSDANFADSQPAFRSGETDVGLLLGGGLVLWAHWIAGTAFGVIAGRAIGDVATYGLDVVMICFFAAILAGQMRVRSAIVPACIGAATAVAALAWLPPGWTIVAGALAGGCVSVLFDAE